MSRSSRIILGFGFLAALAGLDSIAYGQIGWSSMEQTAPPESNRLSTVKKDIEGGQLEGILAIGPPSTTLYVWGHLHGSGPDQPGEPTFRGALGVKDQGGFVYEVTPVVSATIGGGPGAATKAIDIYGQFTATGPSRDRLRQATERGTGFTLFAVSAQHIDELTWLSEQERGALGQYFAGQISKNQVVELLNRGKSPTLGR